MDFPGIYLIHARGALGEGLWCEGEFQAGVCDLALPL